MRRKDIEARISSNPINGTPSEMRAAFEKLAGVTNPGPRMQRAGLDVRVFGDGPDVVWLHGGGYVFGSPDSHAACAQTLAQTAQMRVWVPDYRRAPEYTWPAPLEDASAFIESFDTPVHVVGDSAGGHLALNAARQNAQRVKSLALISPNTDRSGLSRTRLTNSSRDLMNDHSDDEQLAKMAMPDVPDSAPDASVIRADLTDLPPVWVTASTVEVLLDDTLLLIRELGRVNVPTQADIISDHFHMWTLWPDHLPQARKTLAKIATFFWENEGTVANQKTAP